MSLDANTTSRNQSYNEYRGDTKEEIIHLDTPDSYTVLLDSVKEDKSILLKSNNFGESWTYFKMPNFNAEYSRTIASKANPEKLYFAAYDDSDEDGKLFSYDKDRKYWEELHSFENFNAINSIQVDPLNEQVLYYISLYAPYYDDTVYDFSIRKSADGGKSWTNIENEISDTKYEPNKLVISKSNSDILYSYSPFSIFKTENGGQNWMKMFLDRPKEKVIHSLHINPKNPEQIFQVYSDRQSCSYHYSYDYYECKYSIKKSDDSGKNWDEISLSENTFDHISFDINSNGAVIFALDDNRIPHYYISTNEGQSFKEIKSEFKYFGTLSDYPKIIKINEANDIILAGTNSLDIGKIYNDTLHVYSSEIRNQ
tara:strand:- start:1604 stop:2710 length:1107 start_codon:yes stop_codon:yes gene_type:complete